MAEDLDDATWESLDESGHPQSARTLSDGAVGVGLPMLLKMTRLHDLGLAQLCVPDLESDDEVAASGRRAGKPPDPECSEDESIQTRGNHDGP
jgi:hypothetical protein